MMMDVYERSNERAKQNELSHFVTRTCKSRGNRVVTQFQQLHLELSPGF